MIGIDFARPKDSLPLKMAWDMLHRLNFGVFSQMVVMPLMHDHRILTQVAGYHTEVIKFLPPLIVNQSDCNWFLCAMRDVLANMHRFPGAAWDTVAGMAKSAILP
jgi:ornithine--oxo-acid transaminase